MLIPNARLTKGSRRASGIVPVIPSLDELNPFRYWFRSDCSLLGFLFLLSGNLLLRFLTSRLAGFQQAAAC